MLLLITTRIASRAWWVVGRAGHDTRIAHMAANMQGGFGVTTDAKRRDGYQPWHLSARAKLEGGAN